MFQGQPFYQLCVILSKSGLPTANASFSKSLQDRCFLPGAHACCCTFNRAGLRSDRHARLFSDCLHAQAPFYFQSGRLLTRWAVVNLPRDGARHASLPFKTLKGRASDISRGRGPAKFRSFREILRNSQKNAKYREICQKYFQIHVGKTYLILILAIRPVLFTPNVQI